MENLEVKISRQWNRQQIETVVHSTNTEIAINAPLAGFVARLAAATISKLSLLSTRAQVEGRILAAADEVVQEMKETTRAAVHSE